MKIALAQCNYHIGNFSFNENVITGKIRLAKEDGADLIVFSELSVCGYPPYDLLEYKDFVETCISSVNRIAKHCRGIAAIVGAPSPNPAREGKDLFNTGWFLCNGSVKQLIYKALLPTYDVFDEYRYFEPATRFSIVEHLGNRIALTICEDLWDVGEELMYTRWPMEELIKQSPDIIVNIAASPYHHGQVKMRREILATNARQYGLPLVYVNQVGAHTDLLFDGSSLVMNSKGEVVVQMNHFEEDFCITDISEVDRMSVLKTEDWPGMEICRRGLVCGIRDFFRKSGFSKAVIGLSGGLDSAVVIVLAVEALGAENVKALLMPSRYSSDHSITDARELAERLGVSYEIISIENIFLAFEETLSAVFKGLPADIAEENIQARTRGVILMAWANKLGYILLNTSNKSEAAVGYGTLYGDMCGALSVIGDLYKTEVYELAYYINRDKEIIPANIITKPPSAELKPNQTDMDSLPPYELLDEILKLYIERQMSADEIIAGGSDPKLVQRCLGLVNASEHKRRQSPPVLRVSSKAFGYGRRMPIVSGYRG